MPITPKTSSTGNAVLPDVGTLSYNGVTWSCLYTSHLGGQQVYDRAERTISRTRWTLQVTGIVTLQTGEDTTDATLDNLRQKLSVAGATLAYQGKGFGNLTVNEVSATGLRDVAWGPKPQVTDFRPLGASRSAYVEWTCVVEIWEQTRTTAFPVLQFNQDIGISYDEQGYSILNVRGTLEVPIYRISPGSKIGNIDSVDTYRQDWMNNVAAGIDLTRFRITRRRFDISRDRRTMEWEFVAEEIPPFGLPFGCTEARGTFSARPMKSVAHIQGAKRWLCSLKATYVVQVGLPRRWALWAFLSMLQFRMSQSRHAIEPFRPAMPPRPDDSTVFPLVGIGILAYTAAWRSYFSSAATKPVADRQGYGTTMQVHFAVEEGLYLDAKQITFEAAWTLVCDVEQVVTATGVWKPCGVEDRNAWKTSVQNIMGAYSWLDNKVGADVIVDMGDLTGAGF